MILQLLVLLFILLLTLFMATEGPLSAVLLLASTLFASALAMGVYEPLSQTLLHWKPDYAYGITFLVIFVVAFGVVRTLFDFLVRGDIDLPLWIGRITSAVLGFLTAMILIGTLLIGIYMLPLPGGILGYNRYPAWTDGTEANSLWLAPDAFTAYIWKLLSGGGLGGWTMAFGKVHPNFLRELDGYRHGVQYAGLKTLPADLLKVSAVYDVPSNEFASMGIPLRASENGEKVWVIRTRVSAGSRAPDVSGDEDYFRLTPTQVRLVTSQGRQYYPAGILEDGVRFKHLKLDEPIIDDYRDVGNGQAVIQNWVFPMEPNDQPWLLEIKSTARVDLASGLADKQIQPKLALLPETDYPQHPYNNSVLQLTLNLGQSSAPVHLWIIRSSITLGEVRPLLQDAFRRLSTIKHSLANPMSEWSKATGNTNGSPNAGSASSQVTSANLMSGQADSAKESWDTVIPLFLSSQVGHDTAECISRIRNYFTNTLQPQLQPFLIDSRTIQNPGANSTLKLHVAAGSYDLLAWSFSAAETWISITSVTVNQTGTSTATISSTNATVHYQLGQ